MVSALTSRLRTAGFSSVAFYQALGLYLSPSPRAQGGEGGKEGEGRERRKRMEKREKKGRGGKGKREEKGERKGGRKERRVQRKGRGAQGGLISLGAAFHCPLPFHQAPASDYVHPTLCIWSAWAHAGHRETREVPQGL